MHVLPWLKVQRGQAATPQGIRRKKKEEESQVSKEGETVGWGGRKSSKVGQSQRLRRSNQVGGRASCDAEGIFSAARTARDVTAVDRRGVRSHHGSD